MYLVFLMRLRVLGKREVGQFTFFDLALILLVANALQPAMTGPDTSVAGGLVIVLVVLAVNWLVARLRLRSMLFGHLLEETPRRSPPTAARGCRRPCPTRGWTKTRP